MESDSKRLKKEEIEIIENEIIKRWFPFAKNYEEGISLLNALAVVNGGRLLAKILYKLSEETLDLACRVSAAISNVCIKFHMKKRFYAGSLYTFGFGASGRLGDGESDYHSVFVPKKINDIPKVAMVSCAEAHTSIVTIDGDLYTFGGNLYGKLGNGQTLSSVTTPQKINGIPKITMVSCGARHTAIVTADGDLYTFGRGENGILGDGEVNIHNAVIPQKIYGLPKISMVSCGWSHTAITTIDGDLYMFGEGEDGVLGDGQANVHNVATPQQIKGIPKIATVSCGAYHTAFVTMDGDLYTFGRGQRGNLGDNRVDFHSVSIPRKINGIPRITMVSCGTAHTAIISMDGDLYIFGMGGAGRLGNGFGVDVGTPEKINGISKVATVSCGWSHTAIVTTDGDIYTAGGGEYGRLGNGRNDNVFTFQKISGIPKIAMVSCGSQHTAFVTQSEDQMGFDKILLPCNACLSNSADYFTMEGAVYCNACSSF